MTCYSITSLAKFVVSSIALLASITESKPAFGQGQTLVIGDSSVVPPEYASFFKKLEGIYKYI